MNSIGEPDFFKDSLAANRNKTETNIAMDRLMESLPQAQRKALDKNTEDRDGVFIEQLINSSSEREVNGATITHALAQENNTTCNEVNLNAKNALKKLRNSELLQPLDFVALHSWRLLSQPAAIGLHWLKVAASVFCANTRLPGKGIPTPIKGHPLVIHGHASHNPVVTITADGAVFSLDATYREFNGVKYPVFLEMKGNEDGSRSLFELKFPVQFAKDQPIKHIELTVALDKNTKQLTVVNDSKNPFYGTVVEYTEDGKTAAAIITGVNKDSGKVSVAGYAGFACIEKDIAIKQITQCHRLDEVKAALTTKASAAVTI